MNYFLLIIIGVFSFVLFLFLYVFYYPRKKRQSYKVKKQQKIGQNHTKNIDNTFKSQKKEIAYHQHFFSGKKINITGDLKYFKNRNELAQLLWDNGALIESVFNSSIDILIVGNSNFDSLKLKSAYYLNIKVISEEELLNYFPDFRPFSKKTISEL